MFSATPWRQSSNLFDEWETTLFENEEIISSLLMAAHSGNRSA